MPPPPLTAEQQAQALQMAAQARKARAEWKVALKTGGMTFSELLAKAEDDPIAAGMKVSAVLVSMPGMGKVKAKRQMEALKISENRRLRGLGNRQRQDLINLFG